MEKVDQLIQKIDQEEGKEKLGIGKILSYDILQVHERPYSYIARCTIRGTEGKKNVYVKVYKPFRLGKPKDYSEKIIREFKTTLFWYQKLKPIEGVGTIRPLYIFPQEFTIITEETPGVRFVEMLEEMKYFPFRKKIRRMRQVLMNIGRWLKVFQEIGEIKSQQFNPGDLIADVDLRLRRLVDYPGLDFDNDDRHRILSTLHKLAHQVPSRELRMCLLHQDFALSNILINQNEVVLLDFNDIEKGSVYFDVSRFFHQLEMLTFQPMYRRRVVRELQKSFLKGYDQPEVAEHAIFRMFLIRHSITQLIKVARFQKYPLPQRWINRWYVFKHFQLIQAVSRGKQFF